MILMRACLLLSVTVLICAEDEKVIRIGHLSGFVNVPKNGAAISLAIEKFQSEGRLTDYTFEVPYNISGCYPADGVAGAIDLLHNKHADVVLGPFCSTVCISAGYLFKYYNILYMPSSCTSVSLNDKSTFDTLVRLNAGMDRIGPGMLEIFKRYEWDHTIIWGVDCCSCVDGFSSMETEFGKSNITVGERILEAGLLSHTTGLEEQKRLTHETIKDRLRRIRERGRIVLLCFAPGDIARIMEMAAEEDMVGPDYAYLNVLSLPSHETDVVFQFGDRKPPNIDIYQAMKIIHFSVTDSNAIDNFYDRVTARLEEEPWGYPNQTGFFPSTLSLYDAAYLSLMVLEETIAEGGDRKDGRQLAKRTIGKHFPGISGDVTIGDNMDRLPDFVLKQITPGDTKFNVYGRLLFGRPKDEAYQQVDEPYWRTSDSRPPPAIPACGFKNEFCPIDYTRQQNVIIVVCVLVFVVAFASGVAFYWYRQKKLEEELHQMLWQIPETDLDFAKRRHGSINFASMKSGLLSKSMGNVTTDMSNASLFSGKSTTATQQVPMPGRDGVALYKGQMVQLKTFPESSVLNRRDLMELKWLKDISHNNLVSFVGACIRQHDVWVITNHCPKGNLQDVLENDDIKLDWMFKTSLISDLVNAMNYLSESPFHSHGYLKSSSCQIDGRWVLKVTDFGLAAFRSKQAPETTDYEKNRDLLWTAPELLRQEPCPVYGSQAGDVYSFSIILQEILYRSLPFNHGVIPPSEIIRRVKAGEDPPYRPEVSVGKGSESLVVELMERCWSENPVLRPTFRDIRRTLRRLNGGQKVDIMDVMVDKLERYATNLEEIVTIRTSELVEEKKKTDMLLYRMLPRSIAERLKTGGSIDPELYDDVTIYFSDIVGFTNMSSQSTPMQVVDLLNDLYTLFDDIINHHQVYKVETIGDAYMVVSGLPIVTPRHAANIADMALALLSGTLNFRVRHLPEQKLHLRIGIHSGSCAAGIVGHVMPRYCLFGDTVNVASRMESNGQALMIHVSETSQKELEKFDAYEFEKRGHIDLKGKGSCLTFWLTGKKGNAKA